MNSTLKKTALALLMTTAFSGCATAQNSNGSNKATTTATAPELKGVNNYAARSEVKAFVKMMNEKYGYSQDELLKSFANAEKMDTVLNQLERDKPNPNFKKNWEAYRKRYIEPVRIKAGVNF